jgi:hypothetical protein
VQAPLIRGRAATSKTVAARPNRATVSHHGDSHPRASFDSGSVVPQSMPAVARAAIAGRRSMFMNESSVGLILQFAILRYVPNNVL